jgi:cytochrome P450
LIKKRRENNEKHNDFLQLLMDAEKEGKDSESDHPLNDSESHHVNDRDKDAIEKSRSLFDVKSLKKKSLDEDELIAQSIIFMAAGYETTATLLQYFFYEMALNPQIQEELHQEMGKIMGSDGEFEYETLKNHPLLDAAISETLRMYPPALKLARVCRSDYILGDTGIVVPKGMGIEVPIYSIHHDPNNYPEPKTFDPERFLPQNRDQLKPFTYLPFGAGPRNCIGLRFALLEAKLVIAKVLTKFEFMKSSHTLIPPEFRKGACLLQCKNLILGVKQRV